MKTNGFQTSTRVPVAVFREEKFGHVCPRGVGYHKPRIILLPKDIFINQLMSLFLEDINTVLVVLKARRSLMKKKKK